jgi:hypothetical protein
VGDERNVKRFWVGGMKSEEKRKQRSIRSYDDNIQIKLKETDKELVLD